MQNNDTLASQNTRATGKYFSQNNISKPDSLILNNNVIVSEATKDLENIYEKVKLLGEGAFGEVWLVRHKLTGKEFALKIIEKGPYSNATQIENEIAILKKLDHPFILKILEFCSTKDKYYIVTDYCPDGELFNIIKERDRFSERECSFILYQVLLAIRYCHKMRVVHRDIKPENILLNKQKTILKLVDFGLSNSYKHGDLLKTACGSPCYAAPEMISGEEYDGLYSDLWSCGVVLYCMLVGKLPFDDEDIKVLYNNIKNAKYYLPKSLSEQAQDLIKRILTTDPKKRISLDKIKKHPFFLIGSNTPLMKGLLVGIQNIPVDWDIIKDIKKKYFKDKDNINEEYIANMIQNNIHNTTTTIYYLMYKEKTENIFNNENSKIKKIKKDKINNYE